MSSSEKGAAGEQPAPSVIRPGPDAEKPLDLAADARRKKEKLPSPTERLEARVDSYIAELKGDKLRFQAEVRHVRIHEIHHLRDDVRWLEERVSWQERELTKTKTSYASAIAFSWFSLALVAVGGVIVSYATFTHPDMQLTIATAGLVGLFIGVIVQGVNSALGSWLVVWRATPAPVEMRPRPNPQWAQTEDEK
jgi:hypothetical protein